MTGSHKLSYIFQIIIPSIKQQHNIVYNFSVKSLKKPPTSQNTLEKSLDISNVDWPIIYMIPQKVTIESSLRIFQYKILNNILFLNNRLFKFGQVQLPLCLLCKYENKTTKHFFSKGFITRRLWDSIKSWLMGSITALPPLDPDTAFLGHWRPDNKFNILLNHLILVFKFFIYKFKNYTLLLTFTNSNYLQCLCKKSNKKLLTETIN